jgi:Protein of unknown function (DUF3313)
MNTDILSSSRGLACIKRAAIAVGFLAAGMLMTAFLSACGSASVQAQPQLTEVTPSGKSAPTGASEFLGSDASLLQPGGEGQAAYVYINPSVQWSNYKKVLLEPVEFWDTENSSVSPDDQKMLSSYFYNKLRDGLEKNFTLVNQPGPDVITMRVAIINATAATPGLRSISVVIPQARILNYAQSLATGHAAFAGSVEAAFKATDSVSGQLLAESVDKREGGMAVGQAAQMKWGDAESAMDYWAQKISQRAVELGAGSPNSGQHATKG